MWLILVRLNRPVVTELSGFMAVRQRSLFEREPGVLNGDNQSLWSPLGLEQ